MKISNGKYKYRLIEDKKVIIYDDYFNGKYLCLYPGEWKEEKIILVPSFVFNKESIFKSISRVDFDEFVKFTYEDYEKIYLIHGIKKEVYVHPEGMSKTHVNVEDEVNGVHLIKEDDLDGYLLYQGKYKEINKFKI